MKKYINWTKDIMPYIQERLYLCTNQEIIPTLRGLFYYLVSINILENIPNRYDYLSKFTARAREKGERMFETRYRNGKEYPYRFKREETLPIDCFSDSVRQIINIRDIYETTVEFFDRGAKYYIKDISKNYKVPRWYGQKHYVEVWVEKNALGGTLNSIINVAGKREVRIVPTGGQESVTFAWKNAERLREKQQEGKTVHIRYFGDLDPSGEAIERELINKLELKPYSLIGIDFKRVGVTNKQRTDFKLIPNKDPKTMAKLKRDSNRFKFMDKYHLHKENGEYDEDKLFQIEVDALEAIEPEEFRRLVLESVDEFFDEKTHKMNLNDKKITPTEKDLKEVAITKTEELLACLQLQMNSKKKRKNIPDKKHCKSCGDDSDE